MLRAFQRAAAIATDLRACEAPFAALPSGAAPDAQVREQRPLRRVEHQAFGCERLLEADQKFALAGVQLVLHTVALRRECAICLIHATNRLKTLIQPRLTTDGVTRRRGACIVPCGSGRRIRPACNFATLILQSVRLNAYSTTLNDELMNGPVHRPLNSVLCDGLSLIAATRSRMVPT